MESILKFVGEQLSKLVIKLTGRKYAVVSLLIFASAASLPFVLSSTYVENGEVVPLVAGTGKAVLSGLSTLLTAIALMLNQKD